MNGGAASGAILFYHRYPVISTVVSSFTRRSGAGLYFFLANL
jgi:hypothetical protein